MKLVQSFLTNNPCYTSNKNRIDSRYTTFQDKGPQGLMLHSVGCAQPRASVFINSWNKASYDSACVHGFIDATDGTVYQTLPWNYRGWHGGGSSNNTHIGVEMCEPGNIKYTGGATFTCADLTTARAAARRTYEAAVELFAILCEKFGLNPLGDGVIVSHKEGYRRGIASNHGDPEHLWTQLGMPYTMDTFRAAVKAKIDADKAAASAPASKPAVQPVPPKLDNTPSNWSKGAVEWATANKLMIGDDKGDLALRSPITREQFCVILKRYHDTLNK